MMLIAQLRKPHTHYSCNSQSLAPLVQTLVVIIFVSSIGYRLLCGNRTRCLLINLVLWDRHDHCTPVFVGGGQCCSLPCLHHM